MKVSVVTISYNQIEFLEKTILSVLNQDYQDIEYIIVDAGSSDGSRDIILSYKEKLHHIVFEPDDGQADGLNKGFKYATGEIFCFINSDDILLPGSILKVVREFEKTPEADVIIGNGYKIDKNGNCISRVYSDNYSLSKMALGAVTFIQPSIFFRKEAFHAVNGFNVENRTCWDGEILIDFGLRGMTIRNCRQFLSAFRIYSTSISGSGRDFQKYRNDWERIFYKVYQRNRVWTDELLVFSYRVINIFQNPKKLLNKLPDRIKKQILLKY
jgi:glycosyltransferase involved in cell wall biosynthesis